jgi:3-oxoacyl-[acyl-carrier protein] reductase
MARDMKLSHEEADELAPRSIPLGRMAEAEEVRTSSRTSPPRSPT